MSGESATHTRLVERLIDSVRETYSFQPSLIVLADHYSFGSSRPHRINGFLPDLYAQDLPSTFRVVGEAKTASDLVSPRTALQLSAFCEHLRLYENSHLCLAVPWHCAGRARVLLRRAAGEAEARINLQVMAF